MAIAPILGPSHSIIIGELLKYKRFLTHYRLLTNVFFFSFTYIIHICESYYVLGAQSCPILYNLLNYSPPGSSLHGILQPRILKGNHSLLQGIVPTQGLNPGLLHCRQILYSLSHQGNQRNGLIPGLERSSGEGNGNSSEKSHEQRCLVGYSPWGLKEV